jgi:hypothetical protein
VSSMPRRATAIRGLFYPVVTARAKLGWCRSLRCDAICGV